MTSYVRRLACCAALVTLTLVGTPSRSALASSPCDSVAGNPRPPSGPPEPLISGTILYDGTNTGVSGATVNLYRCQGTSSVYVAQTTSASTGAYVFGSLSQNWYYVEALLTGPLSGMTPASGTSNPTNLIEVWQGVSGLNLSFE